MSQAYAFGETPGNRSMSSEMDFVASGSYVCFYSAKLIQSSNEAN